MKKIIIFIATVLFAKNSLFFYAGAGQESYEQKYIFEFKNSFLSPYNNKLYLQNQQVALKSKAFILNPYSGFGINVDINKKSFYIFDFLSTVGAGGHYVSEKYIDRGDGSVFYKDRLSISSVNLKMLYVYKLKPSHRVNIGFNYIFYKLKRKNVILNLPLKELDSSVFLNAGYTFVKSRQKLKLKFALNGGFPVISDSYLDFSGREVKFSDVETFHFGTSFYLGYQPYKKFEYGLFAKYSYFYKDGSKKDDYTLSQSTVEELLFGLKLSWNFK